MSNIIGGDESVSEGDLEKPSTEFWRENEHFSHSESPHNKQTSNITNPCC